ARPRCQARDSDCDAAGHRVQMLSQAPLLRSPRRPQRLPRLRGAPRPGVIKDLPDGRGYREAVEEASFLGCSKSSTKPPTSGSRTMTSRVPLRVLTMPLLDR